jgi:hypothetical protein
VVKTMRDKEILVVGDLLEEELNADHFDDT